MPIKYPLASGNWSNAANWNGGTKPVPGDIVYCDGRTLTIDEDVNVAEIRNHNRGGGTNGGYITFPVMTGTRTVTANFYAAYAHLVQPGGNSGLDLVLIGNVYGSDTTANQSCVLLAGTINSLTIVGNVYGSTAGGDSVAATYGPLVGITITGNLYGSTARWAVALGSQLNNSYTFQLIGTCYSNGLNVAHVNVVLATLTCGTSEFPWNTASASLGSCVSSVATITCDVVAGLRKSGVLYWSGTSPREATVNGDIERLFATTGIVSAGISVAGAGAVTINGSIYGPNSNTSGNNGMLVSAGSTITVNGSVYASQSSSMAYSYNNSPHGIAMGVSATLIVNGDVYGGAGTQSGIAIGVNTQVVTIEVHGTVYAGSSVNCHGISFATNATGAIVRAKKVVGSNWPTEVNLNYAISMPMSAPYNGYVAVSQEEFKAGGLPVNCLRQFLWTAYDLSVAAYDSPVGTLQLIGEVPADYPAVTDVRDGTLYNFGSMEGTLVVPPASAVASGTPVDNAVGTAILTEQNVADAVAPLLAAFGS